MRGYLEEPRCCVNHGTTISFTISGLSKVFSSEKFGMTQAAGIFQVSDVSCSPAA